MSTFIVTPTNIDDYDWILKNPITGKWAIPVLTYDLSITNPWFYDIDPLNSDRRYQDRTIDYFYTKLTERWLYKDPLFKSLLRYFKINKSKDKGEVTLISDPEKTVESNVKEDDKKHVFKYIEKYFINRRFVEKVLREYVAVTHIKWYDLYNNTDSLKDLFNHKLKKLIKKTIYASSK